MAGCKDIDMCDYWKARYLDTIAKMDAATNLKVRMTYMELAAHYQAMHRLCGRSADRDYMLAA